MELLETRFWRRVVKTDSCWNFTTYRMPNGYRRISRGGRNSYDYAHRISWELHFGLIPDSLFVLHHCDNRSCVCPDHLFLGTAADNMADMVAKGRAGCGPGDKAPRGIERSDLTVNQILEVRRLYKLHRPLREISERCGMGQANAWAIANRRSWKHIP